jgi:hypothetical protein
MEGLMAFIVAIAFGQKRSRFFAFRSADRRSASSLKAFPLSHAPEFVLMKIVCAA